MENNEIIIHIKYIISNCHIDITSDIELNDVLMENLNIVYKKLKKSFRDESQIWEDYKYIHNKEIKLKDYFEKSEEILKQFESHFNSIYEDAKKVYERRNKG